MVMRDGWRCLNPDKRQKVAVSKCEQSSRSLGGISIREPNSHASQRSLPPKLVSKDIPPVTPS